MSVELKTVDIKPLRHTYAHVAEQIGADKVASRYQEAVMGAQSMVNFHYRPTWDPEHELYDASRSAIKMANWYTLKDPRQFYYATWTMTRSRQQDAMESNFNFIESRGMVAMVPAELRTKALDVLTPLRHVAWAANMNNSAITAYGYGTALTSATMFYAMDHLGVAQYLTRLALTLEDPERLKAGKQAWLDDPQWQVLRRYVEDTLVVKDPMELFVAQNLVLDGLLYPLIYGAFVDDHLALNGGGPVAMATAFMTEWHDETVRWVDAVMKACAAESADNQTLLSTWARDWGSRAEAALRPVASLALGDKADAAMDDVLGQFATRCTKAGLRR